MIGGNVDFQWFHYILYHIDSGTIVRLMSVRERTISRGQWKVALVLELATLGGFIGIVAWEFNQCVPWMVPPQVTKWESWSPCGCGDGQLSGAAGVAVNATGHVYVADDGNYRVQVFTPTGQFVNKWGSYGAGDGQFKDPVGIAVNASGFVYVTDPDNNRVQVFAATGQFVNKWGSNGTGDGQFNGPWGITVNGTGYVYVTDRSNYRVQVFTATGQFVTKWGSYGAGDGQFKIPCAITVNATGHVYVTDYYIHRVQVFMGSGQFVTQWGSYGTGDGQFNEPNGITVAATGQVYVANHNRKSVQEFTPTGLFVKAWSICDDNYNPPLYGIAVDSTGHLYATGFGCLWVFFPSVATPKVLLLVAVVGLGVVAGILHFQIWRERKSNVKS